MGRCVVYGCSNSAKTNISVHKLPPTTDKRRAPQYSQGSTHGVEQNAWCTPHRRAQAIGADVRFDRASNPTGSK